MRGAEGGALGKREPVLVAVHKLPEHPLEYMYTVSSPRGLTPPRDGNDTSSKKFWGLQKRPRHPAVGGAEARAGVPHHIHFAVGRHAGRRKVVAGIGLAHIGDELGQIGQIGRANAEEEALGVGLDG